MKFDKDFLIELVTYDRYQGIETVYNKIIGRSDWSIHYEVVFKYGDKFYMSNYSIGATEYQDERPYQYEDDEIECVEVFPQEILDVRYVKKEDL